MDRASESGGEAEGDDQDESSSHNIRMTGISNALKEFRNEWKRELLSPKHGNEVKATFSDSTHRDTEDRAKEYYLAGDYYENAQKHYEAMQFYRKAVQLDPDIEKKIFPQLTSYSEVPDEDGEVPEYFDDNEYNSEDEAAYEPGTDLITHFNARVQKIPLCFPQQSTNMTHISELPVEIFLYILRWVVSGDIDMRSLEMCARVCRGFYMCARDQDVWRIACTRIWGHNCESIGSLYLSWREMYIFRPRLCFQGCYISKTTYVRHGENSFQDQFYKPWHVITYFRYLRFFPDGRVLSLTTHEEPVSSVNILKTRTPPLRQPPVFIGYYRLHDSIVSIDLKTAGPDKDRIKNKSNSNNQSSSSSFHLELEINTFKKKLHGQLSWRCYTVFTYRNGVETTTTFDLLPARYPPFWFSRVKSYSLETFNPLCK